jgi:hypothetical protein
MRYNVNLAPLDGLKDKWVEGAEEKYPAIEAYDQVMEELKAIALHEDSEEKKAAE